MIRTIDFFFFFFEIDFIYKIRERSGNQNELMNEMKFF